MVTVEFASAPGAAALQRTQPDIALVSLHWPDVTAPNLLRQIRLASPVTRIIGQVNQCNEYLLHQLTPDLCHGLLLDTDDSLTTLRESIEKARQGIRSISPKIAQGQSILRASHDAFPKLLSPREQEVLVCIAHAMTDPEIGMLFRVSASTVLSHRKKIMSKLGIHSTPKLMRYCAEKGFNQVPLPQEKST